MKQSISFLKHLTLVVDEDFSEDLVSMVVLPTMGSSVKLLLYVLKWLITGVLTASFLSCIP